MSLLPPVISQLDPEPFPRPHTNLVPQRLANPSHVEELADTLATDPAAPYKWGSCICAVDDWKCYRRTVREVIDNQEKGAVAEWLKAMVC